MLDQEARVEDAVFRVGEVIAVHGRTVKVRVDKAKNGSHLLYRGELLRNVSVGGYLKLSKGFSELIGRVDGEEIAAAIGQDYQSQRDRVDRVLTVSLVGLVQDGRFRRGVRELPLVGNECFLLTEAEFNQIHSFVSADDVPLTLGRLAAEVEQQVKVGTNALFASHVGIFGNTGSGKSYTLAKIYHELLAHYGSSLAFRAHARVVLIDFNGEYVNESTAGPGEPSSSVIADNDIKKQYILSTRGRGDRLPLPKAAIEDPVIWQVLLDATEKTQAPFLARALRNRFWERQVTDSDRLAKVIASIIHRAIRSSDATIERTMIVQFLEEIRSCLSNSASEDLDEYIDDLRAHLHYHSQARNWYYEDERGNRTYSDDEDGINDLTYGRLDSIDIDTDLLDGIDQIRLRIVLQFYDDVFKGFANREHIGPIIKRLENRSPSIKRVLEVSDEPLLPRPLTVISLRGVNLDMRKVIPLLICRHLYDEKKVGASQAGFLNIVIDEAHNILSRVSARESEAWKDYRLETFEEIIKEGRKFGVFMTIASQRPHDISETIISQLHNYFLHRLVNNLDIQAVERAVSYLDRVSFESLPILPTGSCVLSGVSTQVPLIVDIDPLPASYEPNNRTLTLTDRWLPFDQQGPPGPPDPWYVADDDPFDDDHDP
ncbi:ATP-binding protein [Nocardioides oceani]|uniref:ATP-binding protein n=1 Tax=Nocardioides oceani TaxID=3058369 RepID=UPI0026230692|nr:ATP-binding protein [Nocardioides oceani]